MGWSLVWKMSSCNTWIDPCNTWVQTMYYMGYPLTINGSGAAISMAASVYSHRLPSFRTHAPCQAANTAVSFS